MTENVNEKVIRGMRGGVALAVFVVLFAAAIGMIAAGIAASSTTDDPAYVALSAAGFVFIVVLIICIRCARPSTPPRDSERWAKRR